MQLPSCHCKLAARPPPCDPEQTWLHLASPPRPAPATTSSIHPGPVASACCMWCSGLPQCAVVGLPLRPAQPRMVTKCETLQPLSVQCTYHIPLAKSHGPEAESTHKSLRCSRKTCIGRSVIQWGRNTRGLLTCCAALGWQSWAITSRRVSPMLERHSPAID